jgi:predicted AlkP superfamily phosphohydrolase/phosphomutase
MHGTLQPEDMTIPIIAYGTPFDAGKELSGLSILDVAPTIVTLLGVEIPRDWEGRSLV